MFIYRLHLSLKGKKKFADLSVVSFPALDPDPCLVRAWDDSVMVTGGAWAWGFLNSVILKEALLKLSSCLLMGIKNKTKPNLKLPFLMGQCTW